jgi:hypothetical protein
VPNVWPFNGVAQKLDALAASTTTTTTPPPAANGGH